MRKYPVIIGLTLFFGLTVNAQTTQTVKIPKGKISVVLKGTITSYKYIDYIISLKTTQYFSAKVTGGKAQMVIIEPDGENMPDAAGISEITSKVEVAGNYKIRVLMSRNDARRKNAKANFTLKLEVAKQK